MSSPSLKDLPKVALDLKSELEGFNHGCMKKAATAEKNVLPSAEGTHTHTQVVKIHNSRLIVHEIDSRRTESLQFYHLLVMQDLSYTFTFVLCASY